MSDRTSSSPNETVAIIGASCRFPGGAYTPSKLWELLKDPVDLLSEIPKSRFSREGFYHENAEHPGASAPEPSQNIAIANTDIADNERHKGLSAWR